MLDRDVIDELRELQIDGECLLHKFAKMFIKAYPMHLENLSGFIKATDFRRIEREAHTLKSVCANLGANELASVARSIEHSAREGKADGVAESLEKLKAEFPLVRAELDFIIASELTHGAH